MQPDDAQHIRVVIADDHPITRDGLRSRLEAVPDICIVGEARDGVEALHLARELKPDVLLLDVEMPKLTGVEVIKKLREMESPVRVLALSAFGMEEYVYGLLDSGAAGYLMKEEAEADLIVRALHGIARNDDGDLWLSPGLAGRLIRRKHERKPSTPDDLSERELDILKLVALGYDNQQIADALYISKHTVKNHVYKSRQKLGVRTRTELAAWVWQQGHVKPTHDG